MSITTALKARRQALSDREAGFTLIELLVVVIIIGILAAIAIPVYIGVQNNARDSSLKSDLTNAKTAEVAYYSDKAAYTTDVTLLKPYGYVAGTYANPGVAPAITLGGTSASPTFCIGGTSNSGSTATFKITDSTAVASGTCP